MEIIKFGDLYKIPTSNGVSRPSAVRGQGFHMINMGELFDYDIINEIPMERVLLSEKEQKKYLVQKGDLLFARQSLVAAGAGKCSYVNDIEEPTTFESHLIRVRLDNERCCPRYYYYLFKLPYNPVKTIVNQCAQAGIRGSELQRIKVPFPSHRVQRRIASILSAYDNLIENNNRRIRLLEQMAENLYKEWFVRFRFPSHEKAEFENGLPKGWKIDRYSNVVNISAGGDKPKVYSEVPTLECNIPIFSNGIDKEGLYGYTDKAKINKPCITISARGTVGFVCLRRKPFVPIVRLLAVIPKNGISEYYLYFTSKYNDLEGNGTSQQQLTVPMLNKRKIMIPGDRILLMFHNKMESLFNQIDLLRNQSSNLSRQRDLLLPRLMSGKLEVNI